MTTKIKSTNTDFGSETDSIIIPKGLTAERVSTTIGALRFNTSTGVIEVYDGNAYMILSSLPTVTAISPTNVDSKDSATTTTFTVTGTNFTSGATAVFVSNSGSEISFNTVTRNSATQLTCVLNNALITPEGVTDEPYDIKVTNAAGSGTLTNQVNVDQRPVFITASGSLGNVTESQSASFTIEATDPESAGAVRFDLVAGTLPSGLSLNTATGAITGTASSVASDTTSTFTIQASDVDSNVSLREFSITVADEQFETFTSSGTFSVPVGKTSVDVLVVAGGGGGSSVLTMPRFAAGAGAGGLIFRPGFTVTPGGTISVTVGCGGGSNTSGQDSVFGTLTAKGGGGGGPDGGTSLACGGSGGGDPGTGAGAAPGVQPTQPGDSGAYGFGSPGGARGGPSNAAGGGGGAGATGIAGGSSQGWQYVGEQYPSGSHPSFPPPSANGGPGGDGGIGLSFTIADGTTPVYYAGGGGGGGLLSHCFQYNPQGGLGGGGAGSHITFPGNGGPGGAGVANKGGGGGGASKGAAFQPGQTNPGGAGGKGVVIVKF